MDKPHQFTEHVWVFNSKWMNYHSGLIASGDHCWLIDPGITIAETESIRLFMDDQHLSCHGIVLTHFHWDHILGAGAFPEVPILTHQLFPALQHQFQKQTEKSINKWFMQEGQITPDCDTKFSPASMVSTRTRYHLDDLEIQLIPLPGHTADQIGVYLPEEKFLWAADTLSDIEIPFISSSGAAYLHSLQKLQSLAIDVLIPGHGNPALSPEECSTRLETDTDYLVQVSARVIQGVARQFSLETILTTCKNIPIVNEQDNKIPHLWNVESLFLEAGGDPNGKMIGWEREWE